MLESIVLDGAGVVAVSLGLSALDDELPLLLGWLQDWEEAEEKIGMSLVIPDGGLASLLTTRHLGVC